MKFSTLALCIFSSMSVFASEDAQVVCNFHQHLSHHTLTTDTSDKLYVRGYFFMSGHKWTSVNGLKSRLIKPAELGGMGAVEFIIDPLIQTVPSQTYTFIYKRSWENITVSTCVIEVLKI